MSVQAGNPFRGFPLFLFTRVWLTRYSFYFALVKNLFSAGLKAGEEEAFG
jgi:hypothetical protein